MVCDLSLPFGPTNHIRGEAWLKRGCGGLTIYIPVHRRYHRFRCQLSPDQESKWLGNSSRIKTLWCNVGSWDAPNWTLRLQLHPIRIPSLNCTHHRFGTHRDWDLLYLWVNIQLHLWLLWGELIFGYCWTRINAEHSGGVAPLFASQFFHNVGSQYAGLILEILGTLLTFIFFVMFKCGHILRERSQLAKSQLGGDEQKEKTGLHTAPFVWMI